MTDELDDADTGVAGIARRRAIDAVRARLDEISRLARSERVASPESVAREAGRPMQSEPEKP